MIRVKSSYPKHFVSGDTVEVFGGLYLQLGDDGKLKKTRKGWEGQFMYFKDVGAVDASTTTVLKALVQYESTKEEWLDLLKVDGRFLSFLDVDDVDAELLQTGLDSLESNVIQEVANCFWEKKELCPVLIDKGIQPKISKHTPTIYFENYINSCNCVNPRTFGMICDQVARRGENCVPLIKAAWPKLSRSMMWCGEMTMIEENLIRYIKEGYATHNYELAKEMLSKMTSVGGVKTAIKYIDSPIERFCFKHRLADDADVNDTIKKALKKIPLIPRPSTKEESEQMMEIIFRRLEVTN